MKLKYSLITPLCPSIGTEHFRKEERKTKQKRAWKKNWAGDNSSAPSTSGIRTLAVTCVHRPPYAETRL
ncbi:hypothetical protein ACOMHN_011927 [Nucella lapillus]